MALKNPPKVKVGVLGGGQRQGGNTNATIGAKHEFGSEGMPIRSFLRMPLNENLDKYLGKVTFEKDLKLNLEKGNLVPLLEKIGIVAEKVVADGFDSGGFGKWKPSNMTYKKNHQTLVETQQLRNSITSKVVNS